MLLPYMYVIHGPNKITLSVCPQVGLGDDDDDDDDVGDNMGGLEMTAAGSEFCLSQDLSEHGMVTAGDSLLNHTVFTGDNLVSQPRKVCV